MPSWKIDMTLKVKLYRWSCNSYKICYGAVVAMETARVAPDPYQAF